MHAVGQTSAGGTEMSGGGGTGDGSAGGGATTSAGSPGVITSSSAGTQTDGTTGSHGKKLTRQAVQNVYRHGRRRSKHKKQAKNSQHKSAG